MTYPLVANTLTARADGSPQPDKGNGAAIVCVGLDAYNQSLTGDKAKTMGSSATDTDHIPSVVLSPQVFENHSQDSRYRGPLDVSPMLPAQMGTGGNNQPFVVEPKEPKVYALDRASFNQGKNAQFDFEVSDKGVNSPIVARGPSAVCYTVDEKCGNTYTWENQANTLAARDYKQPQGVAYEMEKDTHPHYIVRRLTPTECARLQGFADRWGDIDKKKTFTEDELRFWLEVRNTHAAINGKQVKDYTEKQMLTWYNKLQTDSAEYKMWGNGIALPPALYCMQGIVDALNQQQEDDSWMT